MVALTGMVIAWCQNMSRNKRAFAAYFPDWGVPLRRTVVHTMPKPSVRSGRPSASLQVSHALRSAGGRVAWVVCAWLAACLWSVPALAQQGVAGPDPLAGLVQSWLQQQAPATSGATLDPAKPPRVEVTLGQLDPRLKLAPCQKVTAYMPQGFKLWGNSRVGLRCERGSVRWNVFWPVTVKVWGPAVVLANAVQAGQTLAPQDLKMVEVDLAESTSPAVAELSEAVGRTVQRHLQAGQSLREADLRARRWFSAGDPVRLHVKGPGFMASSEGTALGHGDEGRCTRIRTSQGRVVCAQPVGVGTAELTL